MVLFYPFVEEKASWPGMAQLLKIIRGVGGKDRNADTVMHFRGMKGEEKTRNLSSLNTH